MAATMATKRVNNYPPDVAATPDLGAASIRRGVNRRHTFQSMTRVTNWRRTISGVSVAILALLGTGVADVGIQRTFSATAKATNSTTTTSPSLVRDGHVLHSVLIELAADQRTVDSMLAVTAAGMRTGEGGAVNVPNFGTVNVSAPVPPAMVQAPPAPPAHVTTGASGLG